MRTKVNASRIIVPDGVALGVGIAGCLVFVIVDVIIVILVIRNTGRSRLKVGEGQPRRLSVLSVNYYAGVHGGRPGAELTDGPIRDNVHVQGDSSFAVTPVEMPFPSSKLYQGNRDDERYISSWE
uniref:Uncharacterized protein LOC111113769 n=1 Tax=Crassostrea virginica TaxID=6565 RepID=A0A8B8BY53_CRAVI|nr:uncharacterized protein LOC111113769 [Crassostrea virginica]